MSTNQTILDEIALVKASADAAAANSAAAKASVDAEIPRVEAVIALLTAGATGLTQAQIDQAVADLTAVKGTLDGVSTQLQAVQAEADAERPTPTA